MTFDAAAEDHGGWRSLLPENGDPEQKQKAAIREVAGVDWDKLQEAWRHNEAADGPSGLLVIRRGHVVGEWYKDCDRKSDFNRFAGLPTAATGRLVPTVKGTAA